MSETGKLAMELAERRVDAERDSSVARVQASLQLGDGTDRCVFCLIEIPQARRRALPSAKACVDCAAHQEARKR